MRSFLQKTQSTGKSWKQGNTSILNRWSLSKYFFDALKSKELY